MASVCCFAIVALAFVPSLATLHTKRGGGLLYGYFGSMMALIALAYAFLLKKSRRDERTRFLFTQDKTLLGKTVKDALGLYGGFAVIGLMFFVTSARMHPNAGLFVECNASQLAAFLLLRAMLSRPPLLSEVAALPAVDWLPKRGVVRRTPTEIVLAMPWQARAFIGGFGMVMLGMTVLCLLLAFAPGLFDPHPKHPYGPYFTVMPLLLFVGMAFFTTLIIGGAGPRDLRLELDTRRYTQTTWKPWPGDMSRDGFYIPFCTVRTAGSMDEDMAGVCVRTFRYKGNTSYIVQIAWRSASKAAHVLKRFTTPEEAGIAQSEAAAALNLPLLSACPGSGKA